MRNEGFCRLELGLAFSVQEQAAVEAEMSGWSVLFPYTPLQERIMPSFKPALDVPRPVTGVLSWCWVTQKIAS